MTTTFKQALFFFRKNILQLLSFTFVIGLIVVVLAQLLIPLFFGGMSADEISLKTIEPFAQLLNLLVKPLYSGGLIVLIFSLATAQGKTILNCLYASLVRWPYMLIANVITSMMVVAGIMLFILPGVWLFSRLFLTPYLVMLNKQTPFQAIINSYNYTKDYSLTILIDIFWLVLVFIISLLLLSVLQILYPFVLLLFLLLFQTLAHVVYYRHYEILLEKNQLIEDSSTS